MSTRKEPEEEKPEPRRKKKVNRQPVVYFAQPVAYRRRPNVDLVAWEKELRKRITAEHGLIPGFVRVLGADGANTSTDDVTGTDSFMEAFGSLLQTQGVDGSNGPVNDDSDDGDEDSDDVETDASADRVSV